MVSMIQSMFVLGNVYFLNSTVPNTPPIGIDSVNSTVTRKIDGVSVEAEPSHIATRNAISKGYTYIPGFGTYKVHANAADWNTARKICIEEGAHLAIINSVAEARHITELARNSGPHTGPRDAEQFHVGIHNLYHHDEWVTVLGDSLVVAGFRDWYVGEPNVNGNACGAIHRENGKLYDSPLSVRLGFICEM